MGWGYIWEFSVIKLYVNEFDVYGSSDFLIG